MYFKQSALLVSLTLAFSISAQEPPAEPKKAIPPVTTIGTGQMFDHIDTDELADFLERRSTLQTQQDLLGNETATIQAQSESIVNLNEKERLEYIRKTVPIEVRVLGEAQSLEWLQAQYDKQVDGKTRKTVWASSNSNIFVPDTGIARSNNASKNDTVSALTEEEMQRLRDLNNLEGDQPSATPVVKIEQPKAETAPVSTDRQFVKPTSVNADKVILMGRNKQFSGLINFNVKLRNGSEELNSRFNGLKIGDQFGVQGEKFVLSDITTTNISIINMETNESFFLNY